MITLVLQYPFQYLIPLLLIHFILIIFNIIKFTRHYSCWRNYFYFVLLFCLLFYFVYFQKFKLLKLLLSIINLKHLGMSIVFPKHQITFQILLNHTAFKMVLMISNSIIDLFPKFIT